MAPRRLLGQILKEFGVIHEGMIQEALQLQRDRGGRIGEVLVDMQCIEVIDVARALASQAGLAYHDLVAEPPQPEAPAKVELATARAFGIVPVRLDGKNLTVALADPANVPMLQDLSFTTGCEISGVIADGKQIEVGLDKHYQEDEAD